MTGTMKELRDMKWIEGASKGQLVFTAQQLDIISTAFAGTEARVIELEKFLRGASTLLPGPIGDYIRNFMSPAVRVPGEKGGKT